MSKLGTLTSAIWLILCGPAAAMWVDHGDGTYSYISDSAIFTVALMVIMGLAIGAVFFITHGFRPVPAPAKTADEYNADAVILAAKRLHTEMMTELRKAEIEAARVDAIHKERDEIIAHDRKVRDLEARIDEKRRSS